ncbi:MAG: CPBP family intramembrane metalloprotease [Deltaproteobacteria bacterium]|nr:CPBP family intramembrane metalloprotease [Deltaproteobacteria bacterium]MBI3017451.1 CPBP family intramembrane metalloprotease [Deltaproteobacteria bacterium]
MFNLKKLFTISLILLLPFSSLAQNTRETSGPSPTWAALWAHIIPGGGHMYQGDWGKGLLFTTTEGALLSSSLVLLTKDKKKTDMAAFNLLTLFQNEHFYNIYSAYQDARIKIKNEAYLSEISKENILNLLASPFDLNLLGRWTFLLPISIVTGITAWIMSDDNRSVKIRSSGASWAFPLLGGQSTTIGVGEEAYFRGYLQSEFKELFKSEWVAIGSQSLLFAAAHDIYIDDPKLPKVARYWPGALRFTFAAYSGWVTERNHYSIRENVAMHAWWDFLLLSGEYLITGKVEPFVLSVSLPL